MVPTSRTDGLGWRRGLRDADDIGIPPKPLPVYPCFAPLQPPQTRCTARAVLCLALGGTCRARPSTVSARNAKHCLIMTYGRKLACSQRCTARAVLCLALHGTCRAAFPHATVFPVASVQPAGAQRLFAASRYPSYARRTSPSESPANLSRNARAISNATTFSITTLAAATALMSLRS